MNKLKNWLLHKLLNDVRLRKVALKEVIGDKEVKQIHAAGAEKVELNECIVINSQFTHIKELKAVGNHFESTILTNNGFYPIEPVTIIKEEK